MLQRGEMNGSTLPSSGDQRCHSDNPRVWRPGGFMMHPRNAPPAGADAERAAFLRDLRALRGQAGLQPQELAARAHYPEETLRTAESGPSLPTLPVLEAYVRACGARPAEWEERWRQIMQEPATSLELPTRAPTAGRAQTRTAAFSAA